MEVIAKLALLFGLYRALVPGEIIWLSAAHLAPSYCAMLEF
jgi:hypothetical protein